ncbi:[protein-PII] uridylyltransferase [Moraxella nasibovis]|uniref:[protein-PII] uridylyltransferase n=1 Tax=Moraxella nasibovis TaxID=2904120 RepID=UPI00240F60AF|nr:[protein-PII] uridylyltransferase [Moraxella nasibovis]WFF38909.1 [protein-PII] uridylyltransferase [Moraxella nasibovis]
MNAPSALPPLTSLPPLPKMVKGTDTKPFDGTPIKAWLNELNHQIDKHLLTLNNPEKHIKSSLRLRTQAMDKLLSELFCQYLPDELALFAIGGYGRCELFPQSDIDILILGETVQTHSLAIERFVAMLWDIGITPAISVRTPNDMTFAATDHTVATALLEARHITGNTALQNLPLLAAKNAWSAQTFFVAKIEASKTRYLSHNATEYNLEPNIKTAPGGLRDLHILVWLGRFYFETARTLSDLSEAGFISQDELDDLQNAQTFLWLIRHHLHMLSGRCDDRLLFEQQKNLAKRLNLAPQDADGKTLTHALENMMRQYYQHAMQVAALSEMLCAYYQERYLSPKHERLSIDHDFYQLSDHGKQRGESVVQILAKDDDIFIKKPENILKIFLIMGQRSIKKVAASTLKALRLASTHIDDAYRQNPTHRALFLANLQENNLLFHRLRIMKRYGILGRYLPAFGKIMGLMQYDLFHRYTVDAHTLLLVRILHRFGDTNNEEYQQKFDLVSQVYQKINRKDLLVIAAIFHDIAKGRGGDHSELGAVDVYEFAQAHGMNDEDADFVAWLVREHLTMSLTAQKQDISDPDVIKNFARFTGTVAHLNHLYVLTVADMNATNSQLWNSWRASLLKQLYISTHRVLSLGEEVTDKDAVIANRQNKARALTTHPATAIDALWADFGEEFFLKQKHPDIAWQTDEILTHQDRLANGKPIIVLRAHSDLALNAVQLFICTHDQDDLFAATVGVLDQMGLSVLDATILTAVIDGTPAALDCYVLIDRYAIGKGDDRDDILTNDIRKETLIDSLIKALKDGKDGKNDFTPRHFGLDGRLKHFTVPTQVQFGEATAHAHLGQHMMSLTTKDRPALLAKLGRVFSLLDIKVHGARITTLGERAEDVFYLSDADGKTLNKEQLSALKVAIIDALI